MELNLLLEIEKYRKKEQNKAISQKYNLIVSKKLRESDCLIIGDDYRRVSSFIENDPILLWNHIHTKGSKTSLIIAAYSRLKKVVSEINPSLIEENSKKRSQHIASKKLNREANNGLLGTPQSSFQKKK